jgi:CheY-like chemotaxis protein
MTGAAGENAAAGRGKFVETMSPENPARVLVLVDQPIIADVIKLTLNHGVYLTQEARDVRAATEALVAWRPHLAVVDMDVGGGQLVQ